MMFEDGNSSYILVELLKDGFLKEGENIDLVYDQNGYTLNGKKISEPYNTRYLQLQMKFHEVTKFTGTGSIRHDGFRLKDELDEHGNPKPYTMNERRKDESMQHIISMLADDGLAPKTGMVAIVITGETVLVNGHPLTSPLETVYKRHILEISGFKPQNSSDYFSIVVKREP
jgi:hypothetical protein